MPQLGAGERIRLSHILSFMLGPLPCGDALSGQRLWATAWGRGHGAATGSPPLAALAALKGAGRRAPPEASLRVWTAVLSLGPQGVAPLCVSVS